MTVITESRTEIGSLAQGGFFNSMAQGVSAYFRNRRTLAALRAIDEHSLRDIGLTRADVLQAAAVEAGPDRLAFLNRARVQSSR